MRLLALGLVACLLPIAFLPAASAQDWPPCPTGLAASSNASGVVIVTWDAVAGAAGYSIARREGSGPMEQGFASVGAGDTSFVDAAAVVGVTYAYSVVATGLPGSDTMTCLATPVVAGQAPGVPPCPTLRGAIVHSGDANLSWDPVEGALWYDVDKGANGGPLEDYWRLDASHKALGDGNTVPGHTYAYQVTVTTSAGTSAHCPVLILERPSDGVDHDQCAAPEAQALPEGGVLVTWQSHPYADGRSPYFLARVTAGESWGRPVDQTSYLDMNTSSGVAYEYTLWTDLVDETTVECGSVTVTAVPEFPVLALGALALLGSVVAYAALRRR
ncbi:MAG TPA: hypothetical protein VM582_07995 [Candidatus Thermoplasmatota archaeon]|nr:hypothetical protein [Candidatus Thermoplasmatota archaeon]